MRGNRWDHWTGFVRATSGPVFAFQVAFSAQAAEADCNGDGARNALDFLCFQSAFEEGCA